MNKSLLIKEISKLIDIECIKKQSSKSQLSIQMGKNKAYLSNMFNKNTAIDINVICEVAKILDCEPSALIPNLDFLKSFK